MLRRVASNVFDVSRAVEVDRPSAPAPAPLGALLTRVDQTRAGLPATTDRAGSLRTANRGFTAGERHPREFPGSTTGQHRPRAAGGRALPDGEPARITAVAARVPGDLYDLASPMVKGVDRPSWGQLVAWTCQDRSAEVAKEVDRTLHAAGSPRRPRGQNRAAAAAMQVTARLLSDELASVDALRRADPATGEPVTRSVVVNAALRAAVAAAGTTSP